MTVPIEPKAALIKVLRDNAALAALLGTHGGAASVFDQSLPAGAGLPAVLVEQTSGVPESAMGADPGLVDSTWTVKIVANASASQSASQRVKAVARALKQAIVRYSGAVVVADGTVTIQLVQQIGERDFEWPDALLSSRVVDLRVAFA